MYFCVSNRNSAVPTKLALRFLFFWFLFCLSNNWNCKHTGIDTPEVCSDSPCSICLQTGHSTCACPYNVYVPYGATVSKGYEIVCKACGLSGDHQHTYDGIPRRVVMKLCFLCHTIEDHWPSKCPMKKKSRKQGEFGSTSEQGHEHWQQ